MLAQPIAPHNNIYAQYSYAPAHDVYTAQQAEYAQAELARALAQQQHHYQQYLQSIAAAEAMQAYPPPQSMPPATPVVTPTMAPTTAAPYNGPVCRQWASSGRCQCKRCPLAASHTAENSPRYRQFAPSATVAQASPVSRPNALLIVDPTKTKNEEPKQEPAFPQEYVQEELTSDGKAEAAKPANADKSKGKKKKGKKKQPPLPVPKPRLVSDRTPSPPGSRLGLWMKH